MQCANKKLDFSHEKYWIIDSTTLHLSTGFNTLASYIYTLSHTNSVSLYFSTHTNIHTNNYYTGNWSPNDYPEGGSWTPEKESHHSVNRDMEVVLEHTELVDYFTKVYNSDWSMGEQWKPKN